MTTEIHKWVESEPSLKKSKTQNAEKYFDDVPKKKDESQQIDEVYGQKQGVHTGG